MNFCQKPRFQLGKLVATPGAISAMAESGSSPETLLRRHQSGDWGNICSGDKNLNDEAIGNGDPDRQGRLLSSYSIGSDTIWIITEWDRSVTTLLLPSEY